jgi:hypothetical protein
MKYAWIKDGKISDICSGNPAECYHPAIAINYTTLVSDDAQNGWVQKEDTFIAPPVSEPVIIPPAVAYPTINPIQFKLLFTSAERIAIKAARLTDPIIDDAYELLDDPRLTEVDLSLTSNQELIGYLAQQGLIAPKRVTEIMTGVWNLPPQGLIAAEQVEEIMTGVWK